MSLNDILDLVDRVPPKRWIKMKNYFLSFIKSKDVNLNSLLNDVDDKKIKLNSYVKVKGLLLPYVFFELPDTYSTTRVQLENFSSKIKEDGLIHNSYEFENQRLNVPVKVLNEYCDNKLMLCMIFPKNSDLNFLVRWKNGEYVPNIQDKNRGIPIFLPQEEYYRYIGMNVELRVQVCLLDDNIKKMLSYQKHYYSDMIRNINQFFYNPYKMYVKGIQLLYISMENVSKIDKLHGSISFCFEYKVDFTTDDIDINDDIVRVLGLYLGEEKGIKALFIGKEPTVYILNPSDVIVICKKNKIGFYIEIDLSQKEDSEYKKEELVKMIRFFAENTELSGDFGFISDKELLKI